MSQDDFEKALEDALLESLVLDLLFGSPMIVVSVGFGSPFDRPPHVHECEPCQYEWQHDTRNLTNVEDYHNAHKCPKCGTQVSKVKRYLPERGTE